MGPKNLHLNLPGDADAADTGPSFEKVARLNNKSCSIELQSSRSSLPLLALIA